MKAICQIERARISCLPVGEFLTNCQTASNARASYPVGADALLDPQPTLHGPKSSPWSSNADNDLPDQCMGHQKSGTWVNSVMAATEYRRPSPLRLKGR
jgi:hypothetical protein